MSIRARTGAASCRWSLRFEADRVVPWGLPLIVRWVAIFAWIATCDVYRLQHWAEHRPEHDRVQRQQWIAQRLQLARPNFLIGQSQRTSSHPANSKRVTALRHRQQAEVSQTASCSDATGTPVSSRERANPASFRNKTRIRAFLDCAFRPAQIRCHGIGSTRFDFECQSVVRLTIGPSHLQVPMACSRFCMNRPDGHWGLLEC